MSTSKLRAMWSGVACLLALLAPGACTGDEEGDAGPAGGSAGAPADGTGATDGASTGGLGGGIGGTTTGGGAGDGGTGGSSEGGMGGLGGAGPCWPGTYLAVEEPPRCEACPLGTFTQHSNEEVCRAWSVRECTWNQVAVGSAVEDTTCRSRAFYDLIRDESRPIGYYDSAWSSVIDSTENLIVAGTSAGAGFLRKYGPSGDLVWSRRYAGGVGALGVDRADFVYGLAWSGGPDGDNSVLIKFGPTGTPFRETIIGMSDVDVPSGLIVAPDDTVYVIGQTERSLFGDNLGGADAFVAKYSQFGEFIWGRQFGGPWDDVLEDGAVGPDGGLVVVGTGTVRRLSPVDGAEVWSSALVGPLGQTFIAADAADVYVSSTAGPSGAQLVKLNGSDGTEVWSWDAPAYADGYDGFSAGDVAVASSGLVVWFVRLYIEIEYTHYKFILTPEGELFDDGLWSGEEARVTTRDDVIVSVGSKRSYGANYGYYPNAFVSKQLDPDLAESISQ